MFLKNLLNVFTKKTKKSIEIDISYCYKEPKIDNLLSQAETQKDIWDILRCNLNNYCVEPSLFEELVNLIPIEHRLTGGIPIRIVETKEDVYKIFNHHSECLFTILKTSYVSNIIQAQMFYSVLLRYEEFGETSPQKLTTPVLVARNHLNQVISKVYILPDYCRKPLSRDPTKSD